MEYIIADQRGEVFADDVTENNIEETLRSKSRKSDRAFIVAAQLPISFNAKVLRSLSEPETIEIESGGKIVRLLRDTSSQKGDVGVSCSPEGDAVNVDTLIIEFRDYYDELTDRGIVWVRPGDPASMQLVIKSKALETSGKVQEIIEEATALLAEKLLDKIDLALI